MKQMKILIAVAGLLAAMVVQAHAATLAQWDLTGQPGSQTTTSGTGAVNVTALDMVRGSGLSATGGNHSMNSKGWSGTDAGDYLEFGFSMNAGYEAHLFQLTIATRSSGTGPGTMGVFTSLDNFTNPFEVISQPASTYVNSKIDFSTLAPITGNFLVRLVEIGDTQADGSGSTSGSGTFRVSEYRDAQGTYHNVQFTGAVCEVTPVPLPASAWILGAGLMGVIGVRRKKP